MITQSIGRVVADMMEKVKQGFEVSFTRELHVGTALANSKEFFKSGV